MRAVTVTLAEGAPGELSNEELATARALVEHGFAHLNHRSAGGQLDAQVADFQPFYYRH
ncbi:hypothetical protein [Streptomyces murinus]|uniref:hypothetical protein n=1 Tax=Streptomyces murinus TaxID=33900 RepID=UPI0021149DBA|nr:hypothetical protein [Streptomyces murinus]